VQVCSAVQHAHTKGIIHRDLKPSNVLVALYDGKPVPKVIDFGVAKATEQSRTERSLFTQCGTMVGTLEYMSPEQAEMGGQGVDTRSDIYSLGVLLYELLTGSTPLSSKRIREAAYGEVLRMIKEEEPPKPSTRLSDSGEALAAISAQRHMEPAKLAKLVRGELDWIVMKTLEKDRNRRYETADAFGTDVQRYLDDEPVQACPPSTWYRFRKLARRNKALLATATVTALAALVAIGSLVVGNARISREVKEKETALAAARASETRAVENLDEAMAAVDQMLTRVAQERLLSLPQMEPVRRELLHDALKFYQRLLDKKSDNPQLQRETAMACRRLAQLHGYLGQHTEAEQRYREAIAMFDELAAQSPLEPAIRNRLAFDRIEFANTLLALGKRDDFEKQTRLAVRMAEDLVKEFPDDPSHRGVLANADLQLISTLSQAPPEEVEKLLRRNLTLTTSPGHQGQTYNALAALALRQGRTAQAEQAYRQALESWEKASAEFPSDHSLQIEMGGTLRALAGVIATQGRLQEAEEFCERAVTMLDKTVTDHPGFPSYRSVQAEAHGQQLELLKKLNRAADAEKACHRNVELFEKMAADFPSASSFQMLASEQLEMGRLLMSAGKNQEAEKAYDQAIAVQEKIETEFGKKAEHSRALAVSHATAAGLLANAGRTKDADKLCLLALVHCRKLADELPVNAADRLPLARLYHEVAKRFPLQKQEAVFELALEAGAQVLAASPKDAAARWLHAHDHRHLAFIAQPDPARFHEVEKHFQAALELFDSLHAEFPGNIEYRKYLVDTQELLKKESGVSNPKSGVEEAKAVK